MELEKLVYRYLNDKSKTLLYEYSRPALSGNDEFQSYKTVLEIKRIFYWCHVDLFESKIIIHEKWYSLG